MSAEQRLREQLRSAQPRPASRPEDVICCGHDQGAHDDDGCTIGWHDPFKNNPDGCPCRVRGWAK